MIYREIKKIPSLLHIIPNVFYDYRGEYIETWNSRIYEFNEPITFVQDDISTSKYGVLRGLHGDWSTWKLIQCLKGEIFVAVVDCRKVSTPIPKISGEFQTFILNDKNRHQLLIPPGCANGHLVLSEDGCIFSYKQSTHYEGADKQFTLKWDYLPIDWPIENPILSLRDKNGKSLFDIKPEIILK